MATKEDLNRSVNGALEIIFRLYRDVRIDNIDLRLVSKGEF